MSHTALDSTSPTALNARRSGPLVYALTSYAVFFAAVITTNSLAEVGNFFASWLSFYDRGLTSYSTPWHKVYAFLSVFVGPVSNYCRPVVFQNLLLGIFVFSLVQASMLMLILAIFHLVTGFYRFSTSDQRKERQTVPEFRALLLAVAAMNCFAILLGYVLRVLFGGAPPGFMAKLTHFWNVFVGPASPISDRRIFGVWFGWEFFALVFTTLCQAIGFYLLLKLFIWVGLLSGRIFMRRA